MMPLKLLTRSHPAPRVLTLQIWKSIDANRSQEKRSTVTDYARGNRWLNLTLVRLEEVATTLPIGSNKQNLRLIGGLRRSHRLSQDERITGECYKTHNDHSLKSIMPREYLPALGIFLFNLNSDQEKNNHQLIPSWKRRGLEIKNTPAKKPWGNSLCMFSDHSQKAVCLPIQRSQSKIN